MKTIRSLREVVKISETSFISQQSLVILSLWSSKATTYGYGAQTFLLSYSNKEYKILLETSERLKSLSVLTRLKAAVAAGLFLL